jgi:pseudouridine kinase
VAENLARLGVPTCLLSAVGDDAAGRQLLAATADPGVDVASVLSVVGAATATYLALHGPDGDMALAVNDMRMLDHLDAAALHGCAAVLAQAAVVVVDANVSEPALAALFDDTGKSATTPVFADAVSAAKCLRLKPWLPRLHTLKVNALEAAMLLGHGMEADSPSDTPGHETRRIDWALGATSQLQARGVRNVVVTLGALGTCWCDSHGQAGHCAARPVAVVSTAGAGDALLAGLVAMHLAGLPLGQAVPWAMACAELTLLSGQANAPNLSRAAVAARLQAQTKITP